jgi:sialic acid synthase SpsE
MLKKPKIILEIAKNHNGEIKKAKRLIEEAASEQVYGVKFQAYDLNDLNRQHVNFDRYKRCHLTIDQLKELKDYADVYGLRFWCSAFTYSVIPELRDFTQTIKIPSTYFSKPRFVSSCIHHFNDVHISTGFHSSKYISKMKAPYRLLAGNKSSASPCHQKLKFYQCTSMYPAQNRFLRLDRIKKLDMSGFSYHGKNKLPVLLAWFLGCEFIELHFGLEPSDINWSLGEIYNLNNKIDEAIEMFEDNALSQNEYENYEFFAGEFKCLG